MLRDSSKLTHLLIHVSWKVFNQATVSFNIQHHIFLYAWLGVLQIGGSRDGALLCLDNPNYSFGEGRSPIKLPPTKT